MTLSNGFAGPHISAASIPLTDHSPSHPLVLRTYNRHAVGLSGLAGCVCLFAALFFNVFRISLSSSI